MISVQFITGVHLQKMLLRWQTWGDLPLTAVTCGPGCSAAACAPGVSSGGWSGCCSDETSPRRLDSWKVFRSCGSWREPSRRVCIGSVFHTCGRKRLSPPCGSCCGLLKSICLSSFSHRCCIYRPCCRFQSWSRALAGRHPLGRCSLFCLVSAATSPLRLHQTPCTPHPAGPEAREGSEREAARSATLPQREPSQRKHCSPAPPWIATSPDCCTAPPAPLWPAAPSGCCSSPGSRAAGLPQRLLQGHIKLGSKQVLCRHDNTASSFRDFHLYFSELRHLYLYKCLSCFNGCRVPTHVALTFMTYWDHPKNIFLVLPPYWQKVRWAPNTPLSTDERRVKDELFWIWFGINRMW